MAVEPRNIPASVLARLRNVALERGTDFQLILSRYVLERLLYRLSISPFRDQFVLKGALLFPLWTADLLRPTRDLDLLGFGDQRPEVLARVLRDVMRTEAPEDGVVFRVDLIRAESIRGAAAYDGVRIRTEASVGSALIPVQVDIGFGDAVTPPPRTVDYPVLLDFPAPRLYVYPKEAVAAEKLEAIVALGAQNSRMKDFYDLWAMSRAFEFEGPALTGAFQATFARRGTAIPDDIPTGLSERLAISAQKQSQWQAFTARAHLGVEPAPFSEIVSAVREFVMPAAIAARDNEALQATWHAGGPWRRDSS